MILACEGLAASRGRRVSTARRALTSHRCVPIRHPTIGTRDCSRSRTRPCRDLGALWKRPMTFTEVRTLFARGRAELLGRGAVTPAAFATAIRAVELCRCQRIPTLHARPNDERQHVRAALRGSVHASRSDVLASATATALRASPHSSSSLAFRAIEKWANGGASRECVAR